MRRKRMHEVAIANGMIEEIIRIAHENHANRITSVRLKIGAVSGIVIESFKFAFDALKRGYPLISNTELSIDEIPVVYECVICQKLFTPANEKGLLHFYSCPECGSFKVGIRSGEEMDIEKLEIEI
jgi:hydrogenase nickel incorporation protein HypA/HybF